jgi:hypothetical protein
MSAHTFPRLATLESNDDDQLSAELRLSHLRAQVAVVRTLADHIEQVARPTDADGLGQQLTEEITRLGCRLFEVAASLTKQPPPPPNSEVFMRPSCTDSSTFGSITD